MLTAETTFTAPRHRALAALIILALVFGWQLLGLPQPITGPLVNAGLFAAALATGPVYAAAVGLLTPAIALARGILPAALAPMVPFIGLGNAVLAVTFYAVSRKRHGISAVIVASLAKYVLLCMAVGYVVTVPPAIAQAMQTPQIFTALAGGFLVLAGAKTHERILFYKNNK